MELKKRNIYRIAGENKVISVIIKSRTPLTLVRGGMRPFINI